MLYTYEDYIKLLKFAALFLVRYFYILPQFCSIKSFKKSKCLGNKVLKTLGVLTRFYAAELR